MIKIKRRENKSFGGGQPSDLLVCFPSRAHLTLMPKPICSPARPSEPNKRHHNQSHNSHLKRINTRATGPHAGGPGSPMLWAKNSQIHGSSRGGQDISEPTSPKVTCAGQIKVVRPRGASTACRSWQSVMEEIEKIHHRNKHKKKSSSTSWSHTFGFKKDVMNFLSCMRNIRFDFRCFGAFPDQNISSDDEEDDEEDDEYEAEDSFEEAVEDDDRRKSNDTDKNNAVFSKWFMVLQENNTKTLQESKLKDDNEDEDTAAPAVPPPNALLLMRCRSAPAKSWLEEKHDEEKENEEKVVVEDEVKEGKEKKKKRETLAIVMKYDADFYKLSSDVARETWVVGGVKDAFSRSRSWRR